MKRKATAVWQGGLKEGRGLISTDSGVLDYTATAGTLSLQSA